MKRPLILTLCVLCLYVSAALSQDNVMTVAGVDFDKAAQVGGVSLKLNGAGVRTKSLFKIYVAGLYLEEPKTTMADALSVAGPKRLRIVMLRDLSTNDLGSSFSAAINRNATSAERTRSLPSINQFLELFETKPVLSRGDVITLDWIPGSGIECTLNDESVGDTIGDANFYQLILKVWLGDRSVDAALKTELLRGLAPQSPSGIRRKGREINDNFDR